MAEIFDNLPWLDGQINPSGIKTKSTGFLRPGLKHFHRLQLIHPILQRMFLYLAILNWLMVKSG